MGKILYYRYFLTNNGVRTNASLLDVLNHIVELQPLLNSREKEIYYNGRSNRVLLHRIDIPNPLESGLIIDNNARILTFSRKRNKNPYYSNVDTDLYEKIPETQKVIELATAVLIPSEKLFLLQKNIHATSINLIKRYLNSFFAESEPLKNWEVEFIAIPQPSDFQRIEQAERISKVELTFDKTLLQHYSGNLQLIDDLYRNIIFVANQTSQITNSNEVTITLSAGRSRDVVNLHETIALIRYMLHLSNNDDDAPIKSIKVTYKDNIFGRKTVNLSEDGIKNFELDFTSDGSEYIGNNICYHFYNNPANRISTSFEPNLLDSNYDVNEL